MSSRSEGLSKIVLEIPASERKFVNVNLLSTTPTSQEDMLNVSSSRAKGRLSALGVFFCFLPCRVL